MRIAGDLIKQIQASGGQSDDLLKSLAQHGQGLSADEEGISREAFNSLKAEVATNGFTKMASTNKSDRGFIDGCYDLCHSGHFNAIR